jgi:hypothetical protein
VAVAGVGDVIGHSISPASAEVASTNVRKNVEQSFFRFIMVSPDSEVIGFVRSGEMPP